MTCAGFELGLEQLLSGELNAGERSERLLELRRHAGRCSSCRGAGELLDWLELPDGEREIADDPGQLYWSRFNDGVRARIAADAARRAPQWARWAGVAAAGLLLFALAAWWLLPPDAVETAEGETTPGRTAVEYSSELTVSDYLDEGWSGSFEEDSGWVYPDTEDLDPAARHELLEWLSDRNSAARGV